MEQLINYSRYRRKISKSRRRFFVEESVVFTYPDQTAGNLVTNLSTVGHLISEHHWKSTFDFTDFVKYYELKRGTVCQLMRFNPHFSLKL